MRTKFTLALSFALTVFHSSPPILAAQTATDSKAPLSSMEKSAIIQALQKDIRENYVFPDVADRIAKDLSVFQSSAQFSSTTDPEAFATSLKDELQKAGHDKHLGVQYSAKPISAGEFSTQPPTVEETERRLHVEQQKNFCFQKAERLAGNIGYLDLRCFDDASIAGPTATAAMEFLANTDALIIDLRHNGGGSPSMVAFLISYLVGTEPVHLDDLQFRAGNKIQQFWTFPSVPGSRMPDKDVYVLTSNRTFSAAESFTYDLQALKRATIIGEVTRGGANFGGAFVLNQHMVAFIPIGRAVNPITKTNWEGVGVHPDLPVQEGRALDTAYIIALEKARNKSTDPKANEEIDTAVSDAKKRLNP